mmetsp:Transcript_30584/g.71686  ORF Transcript_30584/g.71686 Transcript_30584/m.71686 type:complete len:635 (+) Transcript_30584:17-1921(+)
MKLSISRFFAGAAAVLSMAPLIGAADGGDPSYQYIGDAEGKNKKCTDDATRLDRLDGQSIEQCYMACKNTYSCGMFTLGDEGSDVAGICILCKDRSSLVEHPEEGFKAFEMEAEDHLIGEGATGLGTDYESVTHQDGFHVKCPWEVPTMRLFRVPVVNDFADESYLSTIDECYTACKNYEAPEGDDRKCEVFSWGVDPADDNHHNVCIGCIKESTLHDHGGFHSFTFEVREGPDDDDDDDDDFEWQYELNCDDGDGYTCVSLPGGPPCPTESPTSSPDPGREEPDDDDDDDDDDDSTVQVVVEEEQEEEESTSHLLSREGTIQKIVELPPELSPQQQRPSSLYDDDSIDILDTGNDDNGAEQQGSIGDHSLSVSQLSMYQMDDEDDNDDDDHPREETDDSTPEQPRETTLDQPRRKSLEDCLYNDSSDDEEEEEDKEEKRDIMTPPQAFPRRRVQKTSSLRGLEAPLSSPIQQRRSVRKTKSMRGLRQQQRPELSPPFSQERRTVRKTTSFRASSLEALDVRNVPRHQRRMIEKVKKLQQQEQHGSNSLQQQVEQKLLQSPTTTSIGSVSPNAAMMTDASNHSNGSCSTEQRLGVKFVSGNNNSGHHDRSRPRRTRSGKQQHRRRVSPRPRGAL